MTTLTRIPLTLHQEDAGDHSRPQTEASGLMRGPLVYREDIVWLIRDLHFLNLLHAVVISDGGCAEVGSWYVFL